jgi:hypothetical protein
VFKYPFYRIISIYVSHSSLKLEKGSGSNSDSRSSNSRLLDSADRNGSFSLDKKQTSYDDLLDALRLALKGYNFQ